MTADWTDRAACQGEDPDLFFPIGQPATDKALAICGPCPVRDECLAEALDRGHQGIWGGTTEEQRRKLRTRKAPPAEPAEPGPSKPCNTCGQVKPLTDFYRDQRNRDGRQGRCKACHLDSVAVRQPTQDHNPNADEQAARRAVLLDALQTPA